MVVQRKTSDEHTVSGPGNKAVKALSPFRWNLDQLPVLRYRKHRSGWFSPAWLPGSAWAFSGVPSIDVVHLHWVLGGFLRIEQLADLTGPVVWTLHDMWAFAGGCHYDGGCGRYRVRCGRCPILNSERERDLSRRVFSRKQRAWRSLHLTLVAPSQWLATCARESELLGDVPVEVIPNGLDLVRYRPIDQGIARDLLGLPFDKRIILFGAVDATSEPRKGFGYLKDALQELASDGWGGEAMLVVFGASEGPDVPEFGLPTRYMGTVQDDVSLVLLYSAADVLVAPSVQDNLPNTVLEALACGTPSVAFDVGGIPDLIDHEQNGYLATPYESRDLARGIDWMLKDSARLRDLSRSARLKAERCFELTSISERYRALYQRLTESTS